MGSPSNKLINPVVDLLSLHSAKSASGNTWDGIEVGDFLYLIPFFGAPFRYRSG